MLMLWNWLRSLWHGKTTPRHHIVMYTRRGCHLCDDAWAMLMEARSRHGFELEQVDVDSDPDLAARYGLEVPVVVNRRQGAISRPHQSGAAAANVHVSRNVNKKPRSVLRQSGVLKSK